MKIPDYVEAGFESLRFQLFNLLPDDARPSIIGGLIQEENISQQRDIEIVQRLYNVVHLLLTDVFPKIKDLSAFNLISFLFNINETFKPIANQYKKLYDSNGYLSTIMGERSYYATSIFAYTMNKLFNQAKANSSHATKDSMEYFITVTTPINVSEYINQVVSEFEDLLSFSVSGNYSVYLLETNQNPEEQFTFLKEKHRDKIPVVIKYNDSIWIYGLNSEGETQLTKSTNPHAYLNLPFIPVMGYQNVVMCREKLPEVRDINTLYLFKTDKGNIQIYPSAHSKHYYILRNKKQIDSLNLPNFTNNKGDNFIEIVSSQTNNNRVIEIASICDCAQLTKKIKVEAMDHDNYLAFQDIYSLKAHINPASVCVSLQQNINRDIKGIALDKDKPTKRKEEALKNYELYQVAKTRSKEETKKLISNINRFKWELEGDKKFNSSVDHSLKKALKSEKNSIPDCIFYEGEYHANVLPKTEAIESAQKNITLFSEAIHQEEETINQILLILQDDLAVGGAYDTAIQLLSDLQAELMKAIPSGNQDLKGLSAIEQLNAFKAEIEKKWSELLEKYPHTSPNTNQIYFIQWQEKYEQTVHAIILQKSMYDQLNNEFLSQNEVLNRFDQKINTSFENETISNLEEGQLIVLSEQIKAYQKELVELDDGEAILLKVKAMQSADDAKLAEDFLPLFKNSPGYQNQKKQLENQYAAITEKLNQKSADIESKLLQQQMENENQIAALEKEVVDRKIDIDRLSDRLRKAEAVIDSLTMPRIVMLTNLGVSSEVGFPMNVSDRSSMQEKLASLKDKKKTDSKSYVSVNTAYKQCKRDIEKLAELKKVIDDTFKEGNFLEIMTKLNQEQDTWRSLLGQDDYKRLLTTLNTKNSWFQNYLTDYQAICHQIIDKKNHEAGVKLKELSNKLQAELIAYQDSAKTYRHDIQAYETLRDFDQELSKNPDFIDSNAIVVTTKSELAKKKSELTSVEFKLKLIHLSSRMNSQKEALNHLNEKVSHLSILSSGFSVDTQSLESIPQKKSLGNVRHLLRKNNGEEKTKATEINQQWKAYVTQKQAIIEKYKKEIAELNDSMLVSSEKIEDLRNQQVELSRQLKVENSYNSAEITRFSSLNEGLLSKINIMDALITQIRSQWDQKNTDLQIICSNFNQEQARKQLCDENIQKLNALIEKIDQLEERVSMVVFDPHSEYSTKEAQINAIKLTKKSIFDEKANLEAFIRGLDELPIDKDLMPLVEKKFDDLKEKLQQFDSTVLKKERFLVIEVLADLSKPFEDISVDEKLTETSQKLTSLNEETATHPLSQFILNTLEEIGKQSKPMTLTHDELLEAKKNRAIAVMTRFIPKLNSIEEVNQLIALIESKNNPQQSPYGFIRQKRHTEAKNPQYGNTKTWSIVVDLMKKRLFELASHADVKIKNDQNETVMQVMKTHRTYNFGWFKTASEQKWEKLSKEKTLGDQMKPR